MLREDATLIRLPSTPPRNRASYAATPFARPAFPAWSSGVPQTKLAAFAPDFPYSLQIAYSAGVPHLRSCGGKALP